MAGGGCERQNPKFSEEEGEKKNTRPRRSVTQPPQLCIAPLVHFASELLVFLSSVRRITETHSCPAFSVFFFFQQQQQKNPDGMSDAEGQRAVPADDDAQIVDVTPQPVCRAHPPTHTIFVVLHTHFGSPCTPNRATTLVCKCSPFFPLSFPTHTHGSRLCDTRLQPRQRSPLSTRARGQEAAGPQRRRRRRRRAWTSWSTRTWWWTSLCR